MECQDLNLAKRRALFGQPEQEGEGFSVHKVRQRLIIKPRILLQFNHIHAALTRLTLGNKRLRTAQLPPNCYLRKTSVVPSGPEPVQELPVAATVGYVLQGGRDYGGSSFDIPN